MEQPTESTFAPEAKTTEVLDPRVRSALSVKRGRGRGLDRGKLAQACAIVRPLLERGQPLRPYLLEREHGLAKSTFDCAINREIGRLEGRAEFIAEGMVSLKIVRQRFLPLLKRVKRQSKEHMVNLSQPELALIVSDGMRALREWAEGSENAVRPGFRAVLQSRPEDDGDLEDE